MELTEEIKNKQFTDDMLKVGGIGSICIGILILIIFAFKVVICHSIPTSETKVGIQSFGEFGDFIGGLIGTLFSLGGFFLLYLTFQNQRENFHIERLESNFFEMIKFHRDNISEMSFTYFTPDNSNKGKSEKTSSDRMIFKTIFDQFKDIYKELAYLFDKATKNDIYESEYLREIENNPLNIERKIDFIEFAKIDILYLIIFFGVGRDGKETISTILSTKYQKIFLEEVLDFAALKPKVESKYWSIWGTLQADENKNILFTDITKKRKDNNFIPENLMKWHKEYDSKTTNLVVSYYPNNYKKYYGGHQFRLGHYYRHFFQSVSFINKQKLLTYEVKYDYIKLLRGQLSTYEQIVFFLNSISSIGRIWELENKHKPQEQLNLNEQLLTKYNLIKNIPNNKITGRIYLENFYPDISYEAFIVEGGKEKREILKQNYQ